MYSNFIANRTKFIICTCVSEGGNIEIQGKAFSEMSTEACICKNVINDNRPRLSRKIAETSYNEKTKLLNNVQCVRSITLPKF